MEVAGISFFIRAIRAISGWLVFLGRSWSIALLASRAQRIQLAFGVAACQIKVTTEIASVSSVGASSCALCQWSRRKALCEPRVLSLSLE